jgi:2',3'-cyclic-nucleotide 2'-phosphodiesterase (5'-nucleotidase family)
VVIELSGAQLRRIVADQAVRGTRAMGFSGMRAIVECAAGRMTVELRSDDGSEIHDDADLRILTNDFLALGGDQIFSDVIPDGGFRIDSRLPLSRDLFLKWLADHGGSINARNFDSSANPKWTRPDTIQTQCKNIGSLVK